MITRPGWLTPARTWLALVVLVGVLGAVVLARPFGSIEDDGPQGTLALRRFLGVLGADGDRATQPPDRGTFVLLSDVRSPAQVDRMLSWVARGNRLVVTADSATARELEVDTTGLVGGTLAGTTTLTADCPALAGVGQVAVRTAEPRLDAPAATTRCLGSPPYLIELARGAGTVAVLGGKSPLTNELLDRNDNAAFALRALRAAQAGPVVFGPPLPPDAQGRGLWATLPAPAQTLLVGLLVALGVLALARARRLGRPREEADPSPLPQRGLVDATARLLQASGDTRYATGRLQATTAERLRRRLGLPPGTDPATLARHAADASGRPAGAVERLLRDRGDRSVEALAALARDLESLARAVEQPPAPAADAPPDPAAADRSRQHAATAPPHHDRTRP